jgi:hypothetical protein
MVVLICRVPRFPTPVSVLGRCLHPPRHPCPGPDSGPFALVVARGVLRWHSREAIAQERASVCSGLRPEFGLGMWASHRGRVPAGWETGRFVPARVTSVLELVRSQCVQEASRAGTPARPQACGPASEQPPNPCPGLPSVTAAATGRAWEVVIDPRPCLAISQLRATGPTGPTLVAIAQTVATGLAWGETGLTGVVIDPRPCLVTSEVQATGPTGPTGPVSVVTDQTGTATDQEEETGLALAATGLRPCLGTLAVPATGPIVPGSVATGRTGMATDPTGMATGPTGMATGPTGTATDRTGMEDVLGSVATDLAMATGGSGTAGIPSATTTSTTIRSPTSG